MHSVNALKEYINIEVAYAGVAEQSIVNLSMPEGCSAQEAINHSGLLTKFPEIVLTGKNVGIFGKSCDLEYVLKDGDRVEIYRPLTIDPKRKRELLARHKKEKSR